MSVSLALLLTAGVLIACGVYLVLERTLTRVILGFVLLGNGVNLLFIVAAGPPGKPPFEGTADPGEMTDPLPFAMVLTAIVISLGITAFGMALAYRAWQLFGHDEVPDDVEDRRVLRRRRRRSEDAEKLPWSQALSEESRRGALMHSQGFAPADDDQLGSDLTSAEDVPQDATEADEGQEPAPRPAFRRRARDQDRGREQDRGRDQDRGRGDDHGATRAPGAGPATDPDPEHIDERGDA
ncbi:MULTISPECIES: Na(+)/H(+) antiporter subunit C [unclassified Brachybacterium]|uniref:Na(+)/H(+) antiporter subunit C n=1 Tax=unclassified Brachybacterium TaxID=2623841 RepID=UPI0040334682